MIHSSHISVFHLLLQNYDALPLLGWQPGDLLIRQLEHLVDEAGLLGVHTGNVRGHLGLWRTAGPGTHIWGKPHVILSLRSVIGRPTTH